MTYAISTRVLFTFAVSPTFSRDSFQKCNSKVLARVVPLAIMAAKSFNFYADQLFFAKKVCMSNLLILMS
jgi:hypothetical protein